MKHRGIWLSATILAVIVLLTQLAGAATRDTTSGTTTASVSTTLTAGTTVTLPEQASATAQDHAAAGLATANESKNEQGESAARANNQGNAVRANGPAAAPQDGSAGARPGWGCGDTNHTHSGPPGRPNATPPPGCTRP